MLNECKESRSGTKWKKAEYKLEAYLQLGMKLVYNFNIIDSRMGAMKKILPYVLFAVLLLLADLGYADGKAAVSHYLLLGEDGYAEQVVDDARTDTIVIVSLDETNNRIIMTSILRDSRINNPKGNPTKINLLYRMYGFDGIISCIERELDIHIEGAILVNFEHVKPVIDALGGVDIVIDENEYTAIKKILLGKDPNMPKGPGMTHMTGRIALAYMRDRSSGSGDFSRTERQRKVVSQLFDKCKNLSLPELIGIYNQVSSGMKMSLSQLDILKVMAKGYGLASGGADFIEYHIPQRGTYTYGTIAEGSSTLEVKWAQNRIKYHEMLYGAE